MMKSLPPLVVKTRAMDQMVKDIHKKIDILDNRVEGIDNVLKKIADQICSILKGITENIKVLLDKMKQGRKKCWR